MCEVHKPDQYKPLNIAGKSLEPNQFYSTPSPMGIPTIFRTNSEGVAFDKDGRPWKLMGSYIKINDPQVYLTYLDSIIQKAKENADFLRKSLEQKAQTQEPLTISTGDEIPKPSRPDCGAF
ncbi:MAG: hypothetical protein WC438_01825 [Candidatus Pacearchaeota archaeon]